MDPDTVKIQRLIAQLMSVSAPVEDHLQQGKPLTALQFESLSLTIAGLRTFLEAWKRKNKVSPLEEPFLFKYQPHTARYRFSDRVRTRRKTESLDAGSKRD